jgi:DNA (cytosine-5)-methyltransferase 1
VIPVIDLFAGPGGLSEGFSSLIDEQGERIFDVRVSIEKEENAFRTLLLRAIFRSFPVGDVPDCYYQYIRGEIERWEFLDRPEIRSVLEKARREARCAELGVTPHDEVDGWIKDALGSSTDWVLIGGPPCQAYSMAGRSRRRKKDPHAFEADKRHMLYTEYLRIIQKFQPAVFVMENVKGMLTSKHRGSPIFDKIRHDLRMPIPGLEYEVRSFVKEGSELEPLDYLIESEQYGLPQSRHRVILFGVRRDIASRAAGSDPLTLIKAAHKVSLIDAIGDLPHLRSRLPQKDDSHSEWMKVIRRTPQLLKGWKAESRSKIEALVSSALKTAELNQSSGGAFQPACTGSTVGGEIGQWLLDERIGGVIQHETRRHMASDLNRYMFAASFAEVVGYSPKLNLYPEKLLPDHKNVTADTIPFLDRFRVQVAGEPCTTVVSHICKDGHYYIHPDPAQCRSLTVREAARLQTFPDNYFFEGNRTLQYQQIGNAVPPFLAMQIAKVVGRLMKC